MFQIIILIISFTFLYFQYRSYKIEEKLDEIKEILKKQEEKLNEIQENKNDTKHTSID